MRTSRRPLVALMLALSNVVACQATTPAPQCPPSVPVSTPSPQVALTKPPIPYDFPRAEDFAGGQSIFFVNVSAYGTISADGKPIESEDALRTSAQQAHEAEPNVRALIRADSLAPWKYIVQVMDVLKQAGINKIAFGVAAANAAGTNTVESRAATLASGTSWDCPFPKEADAAAIDQAAASIVIHVDREDKPERVEVVVDPGYGFGQAAATCAMKMKFRAARDDKGQPVPSKTPPIRVMFTHQSPSP